MRLSRFVHVLRKDGARHFALHHAGKVKTVFVPIEFIDLVGMWQRGVVDLSYFIAEELHQQGFIVNDWEDDDLIRQVQNGLVPDLSVMYLVLTDKCNLGCRYCFVEGNFPKEYQTNRMTWDIAKKAIDLFRGQCNRSDDPDIWFYGGEPLLEADLLFACLDYVHDKEPNFVCTMITNGTLLSERICQKLARYPRLSISVSVDGPEYIHDANRVYKSGGGSFASVEAGIANLQKAGVNFGISCTIGHESVDKVEEIISWLASRYNTTNIGTNFLVNTAREIVPGEYIEKVNHGLTNFFANGRMGNVLESRFLRKVESFVNQEPRWQDCAACGFQFVVAPDGQIGICHEGLGNRYTFAGHVDDENFNFKDSKVAQMWAKRSPINISKCKKCEALGICGGGCPYSAYLKFGNIWDVDERICTHSKHALNWLVWDLYEKMQAKEP